MGANIFKVELSWFRLKVGGYDFGQKKQERKSCGYRKT
jgi:hypothetical protein